MIPQYEPVFDIADLNTRFVEYFQSGGWMTEYKKTEEFEETIRKYLGVRYCFMVNNGTISLSLALLATGIKPGDEVLIPDLSMIATANAVRFIGAIPIFVDINAENLCMDLQKASAKITSKTKAIIYVTYNGRGDDPLDIIQFCSDHCLAYISDDAQSLGSCSRSGHRIGGWGRISSFSFSMPKIITTGQGGCLVTNNDEIAGRIKKLKDFGRTSGGIDIHDTFGVNCKFTDLQALVGLSQFRDIDDRTAKKRHIWQQYRWHLHQVSQVEMIETDTEYITPWFVDVFVEKREMLIDFLLRAGVKTRVMYPPMHSQKCYNVQGEFPVTVDFSSRGLWLPSSLNLTDAQIQYVCDVIKKFYA